MNRNHFADPKWSDALTLKERIALLREVQPQATSTNENLALAERHIQRWRAQYPFTIESRYSDWLELNGLDQEKLLHVLSISSEHLQDCLPAEPHWIAELQRAFANLDESGHVRVSQELPKIENEAGFLIMIGPLIERGLERLRAGVQTLCENHSDAPIDPHNIEGLLIQGLLASLML